MSEYINLAVPFFSQRENIYTWHEVVTKVKWDATNKKNIIVCLFFTISLVACSAKSAAPNLNLILPTESGFMKMLEDKSKKELIEKCKRELQKVEEKNIFEIKELKDYFVYEEKVGSDEFIWFISPDCNKTDVLPDNQVFLLKKESEVYKLLVKYDTRLIWGDLHLFLQFNNVMIVKGKDKAKGFIAFENRAQIYWKSNIIEDGYTIKQCKGQYVGKCNGTYYKFENQPAMFGFEELFNVYKPDETAWDPIYIEASEYLWEEKNPLKYALCNAFDGNPETSFVENTEDDLFEISFNGFGNEFADNVKITIINGYAKNKDLYSANNRVISLYANGYKPNYQEQRMVPQMPIKISFKDNCCGMQYREFNFLQRFGYFSFSVNEIARGNRFADTCMAEFNICEKGSWLFGDTK